MSAEVFYAGLFTGAIYALVALGLTIIYKPTHILNFAQGQSTILGAVIAFQVVATWQWGWLAGLAALVAGSVVMGLLTERLTMLPAKRSGSQYGWIIASFAVTMVFEALFSLRYMNVPALSAEPMFSGSVTLPGGEMTTQSFVTVIVTLLAAAAYWSLLRFSAQGMAIRAMQHNQDTSVLMGIPVDRIIIVSFCIGTLVTALAGFLAAPELFILPTTGLVFTIKGFIATVIGGLGSPVGALVGGLMIGFLDTAVRTQFSGAVGNFAVFAILGLVLVLFPRGLFGEKDSMRA